MSAHNAPSDSHPDPALIADYVAPAETFHPLEYVTEELLARNISPAMAGRMLKRQAKVSDDEWYDLLAGGPVTPKLAVGLAALFGTGEEVWLKLQRAYDLSARNDGPAAGEERT